MPTSSAVNPTAAAAEDRSPAASDSEEYEYEEIEIEEEIEVEEEVSDDDEEDEEEEEFEEVEVEEEVDDDEEEEEVAQEEPQEEKGRGEDVSRSIEDRDDVNSKEKIISDDKKAFQCDGGYMTAETTNRINEFNKEVTVGDSVDESNKVSRCEEQSTEMNTEGVNDAHQKESRLDVLMTAEGTDPIKGSSKQVTVGDPVNESDEVPCSEEQTTQMNTKDVNDEKIPQMSIKDGKDACQKEPRLDVNTPLIRPRTLSPAVEISEGNKRPVLVCDFFAKGWCIKGTSCRFRHIKDPPINEQNEPQKSQPQDEGVKEGTGRSDLTTSVTAPALRACSSEFNHGSQKDNPNPLTNHPVDDSLSDSIMSPNTHRSNWASFAPKMEEIGGKGYRFGFHNHNYETSYHGMSRHKTSTFLSSSSWKSDSNYDWQPSKPFRSAFLISQGISVPDIQYDPIRDSIEEPTKNGDKLSKLSSSGRVPSISGTHSPLKEKLKTDNGADRISIGSHVNGKDNDMDVDSNEIADTKQENTKSEKKGKKHIGDVIQASGVHVSSHYSLGQNDGGPTKEVNNYKLDFDAEGDMHRESKSLRHFRAALIEFVKELVRPTWRDGKLSKDAHKQIVKKAVDKVLTSLPAEHIPNIQESIDTYLTSSQPKIMKVVEGYIEKYGKL